MRQTVIAIIVAIATLSLFSCATIEGGGGLSLQDTIVQTAEKLARDFPSGTRVAIVGFESESDNLSQFIMDELTDALLDIGIEVADRRNLGLISRELELSLDGYVSDESALSVGRMLAAQVVLTGQLRDIGRVRRFTVNAIHLETATSAGVPSFDVRNDRALRDMIAALDRGTVARAPRHLVDEHTAPQSAGTYLDRGILFFGRGDYGAAILDFTQAIRIDPNNAPFFDWRGRAHSLRREYDLAMADANQAIRLDPNSAIGYNNRGLVHWDMGNHDLAMTDFNQAIRLSPDSATAHSNRGYLHRIMGNDNLAMTDFNQAIRLNPNSAIAHSNRGLLHQDMGNDDLAMMDFDQAIRLNPNNAIAHSNRGLLHRDMGNHDLAMADLNQAIWLDPNDATTHALRGDLYLLLGDFTRAIADAEAALRINPQHPWARYVIEDARYFRGW